MPHPRNLKKVLWITGIILSIVPLLLAAIIMQWMVVAGPGAGWTAFFRLLKNGITAIDDFKYYPARNLTASQNPYRFLENADRFHVPSVVELNGGKGASLVDLLAANDTIAFLVIKEDTMVFEQYFQGHTPSALSQSFSVTKSFTSALVGKVIAGGLIKSVDQPVSDFIPELAGRGFETVTIKHLLTMTSGSSYVESDNPFGVHPLFNYTSDLEKMMLDFRVKTEPGQEFRYKSGDTALLGLILKRVLNPMTITDYAQESLWTPLGMEYKGVWSLDREGGLEKNWCCLAAAARDFAKFGSLYLHQGLWEGQRILPAEWIEQSTQVGAIPEAAWPSESKEGGLWNYGYFWWLVSQADGDYLAIGKDGQYIYVNPAKDMVIVRLGWRQGELKNSQWIDLFQTLAGEIK